MTNDDQREHFLTALAEDGNATPLELQSVLAAARLDPAAPVPVLAAVLLIMKAVAAGDSCMYVQDWAESLVPGNEKLPAADAWLALLRQSPLVGEGEDFRPLILDRATGRIALQRHRKNEAELATLLQARAQGVVALQQPGMAAVFDRLFPATSDTDPDWQRVAAAVALAKRLSVISGGPGTGKTHTVAKILLALQHASAPHVPRVALAAPTGKAAARLEDAVREHLGKVAGNETKYAPPVATTLHRLLGLGRGKNSGPDKSRSALPYDAVVVDEVSMADLALMRLLLASLPPACRLVLLGDRNQLASVEPGRVFGDLCSGVRKNRFSAALATELAGMVRSRLEVAATSPLEDSIVVLEKSYRFSSESGIGRLAVAVLNGQTEDALALLDGQATDIGCQGHGKDVDGLEGRILAAFSPLARSASADEAFAAFERFRILCVQRHGAWGLADMCSMVRRILHQHGLAPQEGVWYHGRPVMVTKNSYNMRLYNGDIGIAMQDENGHTAVWFRRPEGGFRQVTPARLPDHEDAQALTVHKSQGSEFDEVMLFLPSQPSPLLCRELVYTALSRARQKFFLRGDSQLFLQALSRQSGRRSGLARLLWQPGD